MYIYIYIPNLGIVVLYIARHLGVYNLYYPSID
jgi:hypothetical protein